MLEACQQELRQKSVGLCDTFVALVQQECSRWENKTLFTLVRVALQVPNPASALCSIADWSICAELSSPLCSWAFQQVSPNSASKRGSQVCLAHPEGYAIIQVWPQ